MSQVFLTKYGPFIIGESLPYTDWKVKKLTWDMDSNQVELIVSNGKEDIINTFPYNQKEHQETSLYLNEKRKKEEEFKKIERQLEEMRIKLFGKR